MSFKFLQSQPDKPTEVILYASPRCDSFYSKFTSKEAVFKILLGAISISFRLLRASNEKYVKSLHVGSNKYVINLIAVRLFPQII